MLENNKKTKKIFLDVNSALINSINAELSWDTSGRKTVLDAIKTLFEWFFPYIEELKKEGYSVILRSGFAEQNFSVVLNSIDKQSGLQKIPSYILLPIIADMAGVTFDASLMSDDFEQPKELHEGLKVFATAVGISENQIKGFSSPVDLAKCILGEWEKLSDQGLYAKVSKARQASEFQFKEFDEKNPVASRGVGSKDLNSTFLFMHALGDPDKTDKKGQPDDEEWVFISDDLVNLLNTKQLLEASLVTKKGRGLNTDTKPLQIEFYSFYNNELNKVNPNPANTWVKGTKPKYKEKKQKNTSGEGASEKKETGIIVKGDQTKEEKKKKLEIEISDIEAQQQRLRTEMEHLENELKNLAKEEKAFPALRRSKIYPASEELYGKIITDKFIEEKITSLEVNARNVLQFVKLLNLSSKEYSKTQKKIMASLLFAANTGLSPKERFLYYQGAVGMLPGILNSTDKDLNDVAKKLLLKENMDFSRATIRSHLSILAEKMGLLDSIEFKESRVRIGGRDKFWEDKVKSRINIMEKASRNLLVLLETLNSKGKKEKHQDKKSISLPENSDKKEGLEVVIDGLKKIKEGNIKGNEAAFLKVAGMATNLLGAKPFAWMEKSLDDINQYLSNLAEERGILERYQAKLLQLDSEEEKLTDSGLSL